MRDAPFFQGVVVRKITIEVDGLNLWVNESATHDPVLYTTSEAAELMQRLPRGIRQTEIRDALRLCKEWAASP